jgi:hypothetical protein
VTDRLLAKGLSVKTVQNIRGETVSPIFEGACLPGRRLRACQQRADLFASTGMTLDPEPP